MNYKQNYYDYLNYVRTLNRKKNQGIYYEEHHILPRCLGGEDSVGNLILLTPREHFLAHYLLTKFTENIDRYKMLLAFSYMSGSMSMTSCRGYCNSHLYEKRKIEFSKLTSGRMKQFAQEYKKIYGTHWNSGSRGPDPTKATALGKHWYVNKLTGKPELLFEYETTDLHILGRGTTSDKQKEAVSWSNKIRPNRSRRGITWSPEKRKNNTGIKNWYYDPETELSVLSKEDLTLVGYIKGRKFQTYTNREE